VEVVLDEMPFGNFLELEGDEASIKTAVATLKLDWSKRLVTNYLALMGQVKNHYNLHFVDLTFANFEELSISVAAVLSEERGDTESH
jgi:adenylate cyclase class 2